MGNGQLRSRGSAEGEVERGETHSDPAKCVFILRNLRSSKGNCVRSNSNDQQQGEREGERAGESKGERERERER